MTIPEMPPVQSMEAVDLHLRLIVQQLNEIKSTLNDLATRKYVDEEFARVDAKIKNGSFSTFLRRLTEIAVATTAVCTAAGFVYAIVKYIGPKA